MNGRAKMKQKNPHPPRDDKDQNKNVDYISHTWLLFIKAPAISLFCKAGDLIADADGDSY